MLGNHFAQLVVPFFLFAPQPLASVAAGIIIFTQLWLVASGNFAWLNWMAIVLAFAAVSDPVAHAVLPAIPLDWHADAGARRVARVVAGGGPGGQPAAGGAQLLADPEPVLPRPADERQPSTAGSWSTPTARSARVTKRRIEIIVEGTLAAEPDDEADWREYGFKGKPGDVRRLPRQWAPYHLRLDWLMWFLPLRTVHEEWFYAFLARLLEADRTTLRLLRHDPFDGERPRWVRARSYLYRFATRAEFRATGQRWIRTPLHEPIPPLSLPPGR